MSTWLISLFFFFFQAEDGIRDKLVTGVQTCALPISFPSAAWEDIELAYRLDAKGLRIHYNERAVTRHYHPMTVDSFARRQYTVGRSGAIFFRKHPELGGFLGVHEAQQPPSPDAEVARWSRKAKLGERWRFLARPKVFERLMREHYIRGLRDGLTG